MNPKLLSFLGLARRAGKLVIGDEGCMKAIRSQKAHLILLAQDASESTRKRYRDKCAFYQIEIVTAGSRQQLGQAIGRAEVVVTAVTDQGFAASMRGLLGKNGGAIY